MKDEKYWKGLKTYYETEYNGIVPGKTATEYAEELKAGFSSFENWSNPYDPDAIKNWIEETLEMVEEEWSENADYSETLEIFPHLYGTKGYNYYYEEIAAHFLLADIETFQNEIINENPDFVEIAVNLEWDDMIELDPTIKSVFLF